MKNWQEKQHKKQLEHYRTKRTFNHEIDLEIPPPSSIPFIQGNIMNGIRHPYTISISAAWIPQPWKPSNEMTDWLNENIGVGYYICKEYGIVAFTKPEDAMAFKLKWR